MDSVTAAARWKNSQDEMRYQAYHGKAISLPIGNPRQRLELLEGCDLIYSEFKLKSNWYLYLGIYDIDIKDNRNYAIRAATIAGNKRALLLLLAPEMQLIADALEDIPYCVYASGSKGIHVYSKDPDAFICSPDASKFTPGAIQAYFKQRFRGHVSVFNEILDFSFYSHNKGIRPYSCPHPSTKVVPFLLFSSDNWYDGASEEDDFLYWVQEYLVSYGEQTAVDIESLVVEVATKEASMPNSPRTSLAPSYHVRQKEVNHMLNENQTMDEWIREQSGGHTKRCESGSRKKRYLYYSSGDSVNTWCPLYGGVHGSNCCSWVLFENKVAIASCFDDVCSGKLFVLRPFMKKPVTYPEMVPEERISICKNEDESSPYLPSEIVIEELLEKKSIVVTAPMGSGKTATIANFIERLKPRRIIIIGTRRQQCKAWNNFFADHGFVLYDTEEGSLHKVDRLLVCLNSLLRVLSIPDESGICVVEPFDLLVLDEADSLATWLGGSLLENNGAIFECLKLIMKTSTYRICMEGLPTSSLTMMLKQLGFFPEFHWLVYNSFRFREVLMCNNTKYYNKCFADTLASGENVFFVSNSKTVVTRIRDYAYHLGIPKDEVLAIHGGMSEEERIRGANPDAWTRYRLVLANSSLGPGASFNPSDNPYHFTTVFFLVKVTQGVRPSDIGQLINRVRHPKRNKIVGMVLKKTTNRAQRETSAGELYQNRIETIGDYCQSIVNTIGPIRELGKRTAANERLERERQRAAISGKRLSANKVRRLEYQPTIVPLPAYNPEGGELVSIPRQCSFGLRFGSLNLERLSAHVVGEGLYWSSDSEMFLTRLLEILHLSGAGYTTVGERTKMVDDKDVVLGSHYAYLDQLAKECSSDESDQLDNEYFLEKARPLLSPEQFTLARKKVADHLVPGMDCCLFRFLSIMTSYDSSPESILSTIQRDVTFQFEDSLDPIRNLDKLEFRPKAHPRGAALNNRETKGELITCFHNILTMMNKEFDPATKTIVPAEPYSTRDYMDSTPEQKQRFWDEVKALCRLAVRQNTNFAFNCKLGVDSFLKSVAPFPSPTDHRVMFGILYRLLAWTGFPTKKVKGKGTRFTTPNGRRLSCHLVAFDDDHIAMCKALVGLNPSGEKTSAAEAISFYFVNQIHQ